MRNSKIKKLFMGSIPPILLIIGSNSLANDSRTVLVEAAQPWEQAIRTKLFCSVSSPALHQISSHSDAELIEIKPVGSIIKAGELVAAQDDFYLSQQMKIIRTDIELTQSQLNYAEEELGRLEKLRSADMVSQSHLNNLKLNVDTYQLTKQRLEQQLNTAEYRSKRLLHYAKTDSQVLSIEANPGENLNPGQRIMQLLPLTENQIECSLPEEHINKESLLSNSTFKIKEQDIELRNISHIVNPETQNFNLYFKVNRQKFKSLLVGQRFEITMFTPFAGHSEQEYITRIPSDAVILENRRQYKVWTLDNDQRAVSTRVQIIDTLDNYFVVRSSIAPGDLLIVLGHEGLQLNEAVTPTKRENT
ncbi:efflux RND transporter periplasmic adaptor subunit [Microbulbifer sp. SSSA005]|uniref:efflux RND transporter periplasmic adaptor subunit n=1 Tax=Microbulbifer sp. SSSA005 TaxID=3243378 RepID=UPI00403A01DB